MRKSKQTYEEKNAIVVHCDALSINWRFGIGKVTFGSAGRRLSCQVDLDHSLFVSFIQLQTSVWFQALKLLQSARMYHRRKGLPSQDDQRMAWK